MSELFVVDLGTLSYASALELQRDVARRRITGEIAEDVLKCRVCNALPIGIEDWPEEIYDPAWTTVAGLAMYSAKLKSQHEIQRQSYGLLSKILK